MVTGFISWLHLGVGSPEIALGLNQLALGTFFTISGYHKLFNAHRHSAIAEEMRTLRIPYPAFCEWFVPGVEFFGGLALLSGILAPLAALGLFIICLVATCTAGLSRIPSFNPIDRADWLDDLLYLPEVLYLFGLLIVILAGPGYTLI